jgi:hypothetical protein
LTGADEGRDGISPQGFDKISFKEPLYVSMHIVTLRYIIHTSAKAVVSRKKIESSILRDMMNSRFSRPPSHAFTEVALPEADASGEYG